MKKLHPRFRFLAILFSLMIALPCNLVSIAATSAPSTTSVVHKPLKEKYIPGFRIRLEAEIMDKAGVLLARCYFKTQKDKNFGFVDMSNVKDSEYRAILPAPWLNSNAVEYVFVVVSKDKKVSRTQVFSIQEEATQEASKWKESKDIKEVRIDKAQEAAENYKVIKKDLEKYAEDRPDYQTKTGEEPLTVKTDLSVSKVDLFGFYDNATLVEVPANLKYGLLAEDLYSPAVLSSAKEAATASASTGSTSAGTISAASGGSTGMIVGIGAAIAVIGGAAAAIGSSSQSDDDEAAPPGTTPCNQTVQAGGDDPAAYVINLGKKSGTFLFQWEMYGIKDRMTVVYQGNVLFDTGCVSGSGTKNITYGGNSQTVTVNVQPNCAGTAGTAWNFKVGCP